MNNFTEHNFTEHNFTEHGFKNLINNVKNEANYKPLYMGVFNDKLPKNSNTTEFNSNSNTNPLLKRKNEIMHRVLEHYKDAQNYFSKNNIVGIFLQGSQNYNLDYDKSDIDTKLITTPTLQNIILNKQPTSITHILENDEHCDWKDIRLYLSSFQKQNPNFVEILFTDFYIINPYYKSEWQMLYNCREDIARLNPYRAVKTLKGMAMEKYHAMEHEYPSKKDILAIHGYDPKQLHHILRIEDFIQRYVNGELYYKCLIYSLKDKQREYLLDVKCGLYNLSDARAEANRALSNITRIADNFCSKTENKSNSVIQELLDSVQYRIMKKSIISELNNENTTN